MNQLKILNKNEKQEIEKRLNNQFGIKNIPGVILMRGKEKLFLFSGSFNKQEIKNLEETVPIERIGVYFARIVNNNEIRFSDEIQR